MIPKRTLTATLEISTGSLILTSRPPAFQGEVHALALSISLLDGGAAYTPTGNVVAQMYLYWPGTVEMTETVPLTISGSTLTGTLPETLTAVPGCPLLVIQITDEDSGDLIVAAASPIQITNVLGGTVISTRPPTPSEIIYVGRSPYIDGVTGNWVQWDTDAGEYVDTGVHAKGDKGDQGIPGPVATVNGVQPDAQGNVQLSGANIPSSAITGAANVDAGLSALSGQIGDLAGEMAYIESGDTASRGYTKGQFILWKGDLYEVKTATINSGATFTAGTNIEAVGDQGGLNSLKAITDTKLKGVTGLYNDGIELRNVNQAAVMIINSVENVLDRPSVWMEIGVDTNSLRFYKNVGNGWEYMGSISISI